MEFTIEKEKLLKNLGMIQGVCGRKLVVPILAMLYIKADEDGTVSFQGTDLEIWLKGMVKAEVKEAGIATVNAKKLFELVKEFPEAPIKIKTNDKGGVTVKCGKSAWKFNGMEPSEFPVVAETQCTFLDIDSKFFKELVEKTSFAASNEPYKFNINGVFIVCEEGIIRMVATDGKRLALAEKEGAVVGLETGVLIPKSGLQEVSKSIEGGKLQIGFDQLQGLSFFKSGDALVAIRLPTDVDFPNYKRIVPTGEEPSILVDKATLYGPLKRMSILTNEKNESIKATLKDHSITFEVVDKEFGEGTEEADLDYTGETIVMGFNVNHLIEILDHVVGNKISLKISGAKKPVLISPEKTNDQLYVIMPMKV